jgi:hypothetical protein
MSNVIDFLERLGQDSGLRYARGSALERVAREAQISPEMYAAVKTGDRRAIEAALGTNSNVCCLVHAPTQGEEDKNPQRTKEDEALAGSMLLSRTA